MLSSIINNIFSKNNDDEYEKVETNNVSSLNGLIKLFEKYNKLNDLKSLIPIVKDVKQDMLISLFEYYLEKYYLEETLQKHIIFFSQILQKTNKPLIYKMKYVLINCDVSVLKNIINPNIIINNEPLLYYFLNHYDIDIILNIKLYESLIKLNYKFIDNKNDLKLSEKIYITMIKESPYYNYNYIFNNNIFKLLKNNGYDFGSDSNNSHFYNFVIRKMNNINDPFRFYSLYYSSYTNNKLIDRYFDIIINNLNSYTYKDDNKLGYEPICQIICSLFDKLESNNTIVYFIIRLIEHNDITSIEAIDEDKLLNISKYIKNTYKDDVLKNILELKCEYYKNNTIMHYCGKNRYKKIIRFVNYLNLDIIKNDDGDTPLDLYNKNKVQNILSKKL